MSIIKSKSVTRSTAAEASAGETTMLTPEEVLEQLRILRERIPDLVQLPNDRATKYLRQKSRLNPEFTHQALGAISTSATVQSAIGNTPEELLQAENEATAWGRVEGELSGLLRGVAAGNVVRRERIAHAALQAYNVSTQLVKQEDHGDLLPHVERMKRVPKYVSARRAKPVGEPPQPPK
ncbi:MAG TPA: hypothetical protein VEO54_26670 [Thermoanaerobaculia bacterium]|nr:hypothetical protein [Thermoanaerobaculia bacterium]